MRVECKRIAFGFGRAYQVQRGMLELGIRMRVGDGENIKIWSDRWLLNISSGKINSLQTSKLQSSKCERTSGEWEVEQNPAKLIIHKREVKAVEKLSLSLLRGKDKLW